MFIVYTENFLLIIVKQSSGVCALMVDCVIFIREVFRNACIWEIYIWCLLYVLICVSVYELLHMYMCYQRCAKKYCDSVCQVGECEFDMCMLCTRMMSIFDMIYDNIWDV